MRLYEAKEIIANIPDDTDVAIRFGAVKGTLTAGELRHMMKGHQDEELRSTQPGRSRSVDHGLDKDEVLCWLVSD